MGNVIPGALDESPEAQSYCIWNPEFVKEDNYRELARRYRSMRYQVSLACAAAGYASLYKELDLLLDVSIVKKTRESHTPGSHEIYNAIMKAPARYAVMGDEVQINVRGVSKSAGVPQWQYHSSMEAGAAKCPARRLQRCVLQY